MLSDNIRRYVVLIAAILSIVITYGQLFSGFGQSQAQLSASGDSTLKVAGFAFSIWTIIFTGVLIYAIYQFLPSNRSNPLCQRFGWSTALCFTMLAAWIVASASDWKIATVVLIFIQMISLLIPLWTSGPHTRQLPLLDKSRTMIVWPISLLAGWLTIAAPLNLVTVATAYGALPNLMSPTSWAVVLVMLVVAIALIVTARIRTIVYSLPIVWGLLGAYAAEQARNASLANTCLIAIAVVVSVAIFSVQQKPQLPFSKTIAPKPFMPND